MSFSQQPWTVRVAPSATSFSHQLAHVDAERLSAIKPEIISSLWHPFKCPAHLLPHLAWALSVDVWDSNWSEIDKRREIAIAPEVHRRKGTRRAVETSLQRLGIPFELIEWWQAVPERRRGTFRVRIHIDDTSGRSTHSILEEATARVRSSKPKSRVAEIRVGPVRSGTVKVGVAAYIHHHFVSEPRAAPGPSVATGPVKVGVATYVHSNFISEPRKDV